MNDNQLKKFIAQTLLQKTSVNYIIHKVKKEHNLNIDVVKIEELEFFLENDQFPFHDEQMLIEAAQGIKKTVISSTSAAPASSTATTSSSSGALPSSSATRPSSSTASVPSTSAVPGSISSTSLRAVNCRNISAPKKSSSNVKISTNPKPCESLTSTIRRCPKVS